VLILGIAPAAFGGPGARQDSGDATAQQLTVNAVIDQRFTQTAAAAQQATLTHTAQATPPSELTLTAEFEATVDTAFNQALTATMRAQDEASAAQRGLEIISPANANRLQVLIDLENGVTDVTRVAFASGGTALVTASADGALRLWDAATGAEIRRFEGHTGRISSIALTPDGTTLVSSSRDGTIRVWDVASGTARQVFQAQEAQVAAISPDGARVAGGGAGSQGWVWDAATGTTLFTLGGHTDGMTSAAFSPDGRRLVTGSRDGEIRIWDVDSGQMVRAVGSFGAQVTDVAFSPDGRTLTATSAGGAIQMWDVTGEAAPVPAPSAPADSLRSVTFGPDGRLVAAASAGQNGVWLWNAATGGLVTIAGSQFGPAVDVSFSPDGALLATGGDTARVWAVVVGSNPTPVPIPTNTPAPISPTPLPPLFPTNVYSEVQIVEQVFEHGRMFWIRHTLQIWVMTENPVGSSGGDWFCYNDTFQEGDPEIDPSLVPPTDLLQPRRGFGKLWRAQIAVRDALGWATTPEFDLTSSYTYIAGGTVENDQYIPGPGTHQLTTLYRDTISFFEQNIRGDCLGGTWRMGG
jgi:WD40 repeat protein